MHHRPRRKKLSPAILLIAAAIGASVLAADEVKPKKAVDPKNPFSLGTGPLDEIKALSWMAGKWTIKVRYFAPDGKTYDSETDAVIEPVLNGSFLQERMAAPMGAMKNNLIGMRSFDRFKGVYRLVWFDEFITLADVYEGPATETGFSVTNVKSDTSAVWQGKSQHTKFEQVNGPNHDSFTVIWSASDDGGKTWTKATEYVYARVQD